MAKRNKYCYHCDGLIEEEDLTQVVVPTLTKVGLKNYKKNIHKDCVEAFQPELQSILEKTAIYRDTISKKKPVDLCYFCGEEVSERELVKKDIVLHAKRRAKPIERILHAKCVEIYMSGLEIESETKEENTWWEKCYEKFKEVMGVKKANGLDEHSVMRLLGLRNGKYYPNGNTRILKRGYDFDVIYYTLLYCTNSIQYAFSTMSFSDQKHKTDYAMKIIFNNVNYISEQVESKNRAERKLRNVSVEDKTEYEELYQSKTDTEISTKIKVAVSQIVAEEDDILSDIDSLFKE